jgi:hypothetical protein
MENDPSSECHGYGYTRGFHTGLATGTGTGTRMPTWQKPVPVPVMVMHVAQPNMASCVTSLLPRFHHHLKAMQSKYSNLSLVLQVLYR